MRRRALLALLGGLWIVAGLCAESADPLWTLDAARVVPEGTHERPVLVFVTAPWSRVAQRFEREVLGAAEVRAALGRDFLCARLAAPLPEETVLRWRVVRWPSLVLLDRHGAWVRTIEGEMPAEHLLRQLSAALPELVESDAATAEALGADEVDVPERLRRARYLVEQGLVERALALLEALVEADPEDAQYAGLWAAGARARAAYRADDVAGGDRWRERALTLEAVRGGALWAAELRGERMAALTRARRFDDAQAEIDELRGEPLSDEESAALDLAEARLLRSRGQEAEGLARLQALWDQGRGPTHEAAEADLERWAFSAGAAADEWRTLRDGRELVRQFGCVECHAIEPAVAVDVGTSCVACHQRVAGTANHPKDLAAALASEPEWYSHARNIRHYLYAPYLGTVGARMKREWLRAFLRRPVDVRPFLAESMPRLPLSDGQVELALDYLEAVAARRVGRTAPIDLPAGDAARGESLFQERGCQACHLFGNRRFPEGPPAAPWPRLAAENVRHAPNLRWARDRLRPEMIAAWIREPQRFVPGTLMPAQKLPEQELADLVAFLMHGDLGAPAPVAPEAALPEARRDPVRVEEATEVFHDMCKHCHLPDEKGGIGNTGGGWGYAPRGLDLETPTGPLRGSFGTSGRRRPILAAPPGEARAPILQRILWRLDENRWDAWAPYGDPLVPIPTERYDHPPGMPLGLPALTTEEIAMLRGWVEGGR